MHALTIENVHKSFGPTKVLEGINIEIDAGQFLILVGPSGCGKSTLLHMIAGLEMVTEGRIHIGDRDVTHLSPKDRNIAMVFQSYALYPNMNVERNISFGLEIQKVPRQEREAKVAEVAKILQIESLLDRKPSQLSGGQRQRVAMGRALARDPSIFLFDEPLSNLDAKLRVEMRSEIKLLHERLAATIVYVTHDQIEAMTMGDRIAVMHQGRIQQFGSPGEIYEKPANMFVAGFIGSPSMNFLPVQVARWQSEIGAEVQGSSDAVFVPLPTGESLNGWVGRNAVLGVRPEQLHAAPASGGDAIACNVGLLEPTGPDTLVSVQLNGKKAVARLRPDKVSAIGETLGLTVDSDKTVLFDPKSEQRII